MDGAGNTFSVPQVGLQVDVHLQQLVHPLPLRVALLSHANTREQLSREKKIELHRAHTEARMDIFHQMPLKYHKSASAKHQNKIGISFKIR